MSIGRKQYPFDLVEQKWQSFWERQQTFRAWNPGETVPEGHPFAVRHGLGGKKPSASELPPKFYVLDMFPYPSGAGLHVGHPEGYTATDILARYKRAQGFNVLHPMGWDAFGLPAEQYAVKTGQHPRKTTEENIATFKRQIKSLGFSYDWSREVDTTDPKYFKWTQWIFLKLYNSWFNPQTNKAEPIESLNFPPELQITHPLPKGEGRGEGVGDALLEAGRRAFRDSKRLAFVSEAPVNWCPELGTVLANEEVIDGKSEVGGFPVIRRPMRQWMLRITAYAERLLSDLDTIEWTDSLKEMQRNWIGRSEGAEVDFQVAGSSEKIRVFTTRPDTLFGATYMVLSPEHKLVEQITTPGQKKAVEDYKTFASGKSDLERTELAKEKTGVFTGAFAINPVNGEKIPIWIADYVLASYGTGAIMAVPAHDERDWEFAKVFGLPIRAVVAAEDNWLCSAAGRQGEIAELNGLSINELHKAYKKNAGLFEKANTNSLVSCNSANDEIDINGLQTEEAWDTVVSWLEKKGLGKKTINYKLRDWLFSRQRYWGEPFPIVWKKDAAGNLHHEAVPEKSLPVLPPQLDDYKPTPDGMPPLARAADWVKLKNGAERETNTMPQWAGSCWYYLRYLDAQGEARFVGKEAEQYWMGGERRPGNFLVRSPADWRAELDNLIRRAFADGKRPPYTVEFAVVSDALAEKTRLCAGVDVEGFHHSLDVYSVRHIFNRHGSPFFEEARGNIPVTREDLERLPEILAEPDSVEFSSRQPHGFKRFVISKRINGFIFVVEEARGKNRQMQVITVHKNKSATGRDVTTKAPLSATPEASRHTLNRPQDPPLVKTTPGVDLYVGGTEHAVLHLLYARFWHKVLYDLGYVSTAEPFFKLVNQGLILGEDNQKMSKSRGNVVNPDDVLAVFGTDALRLYEMFMGPLEMVKPWSTKGVEGVYRFLGRVWRLFVDEASETEFEQAETTADASNRAALLEKIRLDSRIQDIAPTPAQLKALHACIKKVTEDLDGMRFNTAISALMVFTNDAMKWEVRPKSVLRDFLMLLQPFAPHLAEELASKMAPGVAGGSATLAYAPWPKFDPALLVEDTMEIPVQVNGKLRDTIVVAADATQADLEKAAFASEKAKPFIEGKQVKKVIIVPKRMVNIVVF